MGNLLADVCLQLQDFIHIKNTSSFPKIQAPLIETDPEEINNPGNAHG